MKNRVALYIRVSTEEQAQEGYSLEAQEQTLTGYCKSQNYKVVEKYIDDGKSGKNTDRQNCNVFSRIAKSRNMIWYLFGKYQDYLEA